MYVPTCIFDMYTHPHTWRQRPVVLLRAHMNNMCIYICNTLQHTATHLMQHTATHTNNMCIYIYIHAYIVFTYMHIPESNPRQSCCMCTYRICTYVYTYMYARYAYTHACPRTTPSSPPARAYIYISCIYVHVYMIHIYTHILESDTLKRRCLCTHMISIYTYFRTCMWYTCIHLRAIHGGPAARVHMHDVYIHDMYIYVTCLYIYSYMYLWYVYTRTHLRAMHGSSAACVHIVYVFIHIRTCIFDMYIQTHTPESDT